MAQQQFSSAASTAFNGQHSKSGDRHFGRGYTAPGRSALVLNAGNLGGQTGFSPRQRVGAATRSRHFMYQDKRHSVDNIDALQEQEDMQESLNSNPVLSFLMMNGEIDNKQGRSKVGRNKTGELASQFPQNAVRQVCGHAAEDDGDSDDGYVDGPTFGDQDSNLARSLGYNQLRLNPSKQHGANSTMATFRSSFGGSSDSATSRLVPDRGESYRSARRRWEGRHSAHHALGFALPIRQQRHASEMATKVRCVFPCAKSANTGTGRFICVAFEYPH